MSYYNKMYYSNCSYNAQGHFECKSIVNSNSKKYTKYTHPIVENFVANEDTKFVQCGLLLNDKEAAKECPICCIKNGQQWFNTWQNKDKKTFCKCQDNDKINLLADTAYTIRPDIMNQMSSQIWSLGKKTINECVSACEKDKNCRFLMMDNNQTCWNTNLDPAIATKTFKPGFLTGLKY